MKRLYILMGWMTFLLMAFTISFDVSAATGKTTISVDQVTVESESNIIVPVRIENNTGICGASLNINYDEKLTLTAVSSGTAFSTLSMTKPGDLNAKSIVLVWDGIEADTSDGEIAVLSFSNPGKAGTYNIDISCEEGDVIDGNLNPVDIDFINGSITVRDLEEEKQIEDQKKADSVTEIINNMNVSDKTSVSEARKEFEALTAEQQALVSEETYKKLTDAEEALEEAEKAAEEKAKADKAAIEAVETALSSVTSDDKNSVESARALYDALDEGLKEKVDQNLLKKLTDAEEAIKQAEKEAEEKAKEDKKKAEEIETTILNLDFNDKESINSARKAYDELTDDQKKLVDPDIFTVLTDAEKAIAEAEEKEKTEKEKAEAADKAFSEMKADDRSSVEAARKAYEALTPEQKEQISPLILKELTDAEETFKKIDQAAADKIVEQIQSMNVDDENAVKKVKEAYNSLTDAQKALVKEEALKKLTDAEEAILAKDNAAEDKPGTEPSVTPGKPASGGEGANTPEPVKVMSIKLTGISTKIAAGKKIKLKGEVLPEKAANKKLNWTTSNKKIATVTQTGLVKINKKAKGKSVIITAAAADGSGKKAVWKIKVMKGLVKKLTVKGAKKTIKSGKTMKLKVTVKATKGANKKVQWTSSNEKFATVNAKGVVKAMKAGKGKTVRITVMATDGSNVKKVVKFKIK